jgi:RNA polymerase sigma-70 factor (ECF subfamily)
MPAGGDKEEAPSARAESDRALAAAMAAAQAGDRDAYQMVLRECVPIVRRIARHQGASADFLDDVVQDVLVTIHGARATYDPARSFTAWLTAITQRRTIDILRKLGRRGAREVHSPIAFETYAAPDNPEEDIARQAEAGRLRAFVAGLPDVQREAVRELALEEKSLEDASKSTGRTKTALKVNLHRAIRTLRARMSGEPR